MHKDERVNILLVDDQPGKLLSYEVILAELGENLIQAASAKEALTHLLQTEVAVVLLDVCMPDIDGFELAKMIRTHPRCEHTSIILVSAIYLSDIDRLRGYGAGAVDYVPVPIVPELLRAKVSVFAELYRKSVQLERLNDELERRVEERTRELEHTAAHLRESEAQFRRTFECNMIPMGIWSADGTITEANGALLNLLGFSRAELSAGQIRWRDLGLGLGTDVAANFRQHESETGVGIVDERTLTHKDGRSVPILFGGAAFGDDASRGVFFAVDNLDRKRAESERAMLLESERQARASAEAANRLKDEFLATLSHELRTPISAVLGWVQLMNRGKLDPAAMQEGMRVIERGVRTQVRLIDELLDVNRITSGKFRIVEKEIDLAAILVAALDTVNGDAQSRRVTLECSGESGPVLSRGDATKLQQVFWNLLSNAVKFTPPGGKIEMRVERLPMHARITVTDTGQGIAPELLPRIFERFWQGDNSITRAHGGLGLGLAIAKHIIEMHGGTISAESEGERRGARFTVALPLKYTVANRTPLQDDDAASGECDLAGAKILVTDDDAATRDIVARTLRESGAQTAVAASAQDALAALDGFRADALVFDLGMPVMDGFELMRQVRARPQFATIPALALSAYTRPEDKARALAAGYNVHLSKPVNPTELIGTLAALIGRNVQRHVSV